MFLEDGGDMRQTVNSPFETVVSGEDTPSMENTQYLKASLEILACPYA